ncbi:hypothetical protein P167DRAFT_533713 [Morchella conica CCBAS932]|uniref:Uncharacterized protein n=1 Tax=Morchella conica CCBAS932 TaxID=1392247 RepID=A0A3N4KW00_9PEZI|nr:hypothetical protein P167DRAFT_533713 [Morchella conica CCBAS932]
MALSNLPRRWKRQVANTGTLDITVRHDSPKGGLVMTINIVMVVTIAAPWVLEGDYGCRVDSISPCQSCTGPDLGL